MALVLRDEQGNKNAYKSLIAAEYCGVEVKHVKEFQLGVSDKTHLFLNGRVFVDRNRLGKAPVLETPEGPIVESNAMARYIAKFKGDSPPLCGSSVYEFVQIEQWMAFATTEIDEVLTRWIYPRIGVYPYNALSEHIVIGCMKRALHILNTHLAPDYKYLVGDRMTLADIVVTCDLYLGFTHVMAKSFTKEFPHVERYFWNLVGQPNFKKFLGEVKQADPLPERPPRKLFLRREVTEAVKKQRATQMMKEEGVSNQTVEAQKDEGVCNQTVEAQKDEGVCNQTVEAQKDEGVCNQTVEAQKDEGVCNRTVEKQKDEGVCNRTVEKQKDEGVSNQMVLHVGVLDKRDACKTLITAEYSCVKVEIVKFGEKYSVLETADGPVAESNSMARYIAKLKGDNTPLYGSGVYEYAQVEEWMEFACTEIEEGLKKWIYQGRGLGPCDPHHWMGMRIAAVQHSLRVLDAHLATDTKYLVGNRITLADIVMTCALHFGFTRAMTKSFTAEFPHVEQYFWNLVGKEEFKKTLGAVKQAESPPPEWPVQPTMLGKKYVDLEQITEARKKRRVNQMKNEKIDEYRER